MEIPTMRYPTTQYRLSKRPKKHQKKLPFMMLLILLGIVIGGYSYLALKKPLPLLTAVGKTISIPAVPQSINWPGGVDAAVGSYDYSKNYKVQIIGKSNPHEQPRSIASIAKVITALAVLKKMPITGVDAPIITFGASDEAFYNHYENTGGSYVPIHAGDQLSEYEAIEAMLLPSANNIADSLAVWAFGSIEAYTAYANVMVKDMGLQQTTVGDASGFSDTVLSTPTELLTLGQQLLEVPQLAHIVMTENASLPSLGTLHNTNQLLGGEMVGIKTGHTTGAGFCLLLARVYKIDSTHSVLLLSAVLGANNMEDSFSSSTSITSAAKDEFGLIPVLPKGAVVGSYDAPWGARSAIVTTSPVAVYGWKGTERKVIPTLDKLQTPSVAGSGVGKIDIVGDGNFHDSYGLAVNSRVLPPSNWWRLTHLF